jgi:hypothetical protein
MLFHLGGVPVSGGLGLLGLNGGRWYFFDPTNGTTDGDAIAPGTANSNLVTVYALLRSGRNDGIVFMTGATSYQPTAAFDWNKPYTHLIGANNALPGMGQRARIVNSSTNDLATLFTVSADGCEIANVQFFDGKDSAADGAALLVSGDRNKFTNCFVAGMGDATASGPFSRAGSYSMKISGAENAVIRSTIGLDTVARTAANHELIVSGERNRIIQSEIRSNSTTAGKFLVKIDASADLRDIQFEDCLFFNYTTNWATGITDAFNITGGSTHYVILRGSGNQFVGVGMGVANTVTRVYGAGPAPNAGMFISTQPTT